MAASTLVFSLLGLVLSLAALWWSINLGISLTMVLLERATAYCRDGLAVERIRRQAREYQRRLDVMGRERRGWCLIDLDGRRRWLERDQLEGFAHRCWQELGLAAPCSPSELRRHWRRGSLRWHPDQGGDPEAWLRRLRAYEALRQLSRDASARALVRAMPPPLPAARRWGWQWRSRRP